MELRPTDLFQSSGSGPITPKIFICSPSFSIDNLYTPDDVSSNNPSYTSSLTDWDSITLSEGSKIFAVIVEPLKSIICTIQFYFYN